MNIQEELNKAVIQSKEIESLLMGVINQDFPAPVVASPMQIEEDEWLEPLGSGCTIILRGGM